MIGGFESWAYHGDKFMKDGRGVSYMHVYDVDVCTVEVSEPQYY